MNNPDADSWTPSYSLVCAVLIDQHVDLVKHVVWQVPRYDIPPVVGIVRQTVITFVVVVDIAVVVIIVDVDVLPLKPGLSRLTLHLLCDLFIVGPALLLLYECNILCV